jgi:predicted DNA binding CopG/RHH family protein
MWRVTADMLTRKVVSEDSTWDEECGPLADDQQNRRVKRKEQSDDMPATAAPPQEGSESAVNFGGRIPAALRRRVRLTAADQGVHVQEVLRAALEEYTTRRGFGPDT